MLPIEDFFGLYCVTPDGRIWSERMAKFLKPKTDKYGYFSVCLRKDKKNFHKTIHRLVAKTYIENPDNKPQVNHLDCNKKNNNVSNLEWVTGSENTKHAYKNGLWESPNKGKFGEGHSCSKTIVKLNLDGSICETFKGIAEYCRQNKHSNRHFRYCLDNGLKYKGFLYKKV